MRYAAFLRAINVGGRTVTMARLREALAPLGLEGLQTVIASGNVLFESPEEDAAALEKLSKTERATRLRFAGRIMSEDEAHNRGEELDQAESREAMSRQELEHALQQEFALSIDDLPEHVQQALQEILT